MDSFVNWTHEFLQIFYAYVHSFTMIEHYFGNFRDGGNISYHLNLGINKDVIRFSLKMSLYNVGVTYHTHGFEET